MTFDETNLAHELIRITSRYEQWERPLRRYRAQNYGRLNKDGFTWEAYQRGLSELETQLRAEADPRADLHPLFQQLCQSYIDGNSQERSAIRSFVSRRTKLGGLLWRYANSLAAQIKHTGDALKLMWALAAASMENCASNYRDTMMTLADLYIAAEQAGLQPRQSFAAAAEWSTDVPTTGGCESLAALFREFHSGSVLCERRLIGAPYGGPT